MARRDLAIALALGSAAVALYLASGRPTPWDYHARLAAALLQGKWWLEEAPPHLNELVACGEGRYCLVYPLSPALLALPFVLFLASETAQWVASAVVAGLAAMPTYLALRRIGAPPQLGGAVTAFAMVGTTLWFSASDGRAWYFAHSVVVLFATLAVLAALDARPAWLVGALIGVAALARLPVLLAAPGLALLVCRARGEPLPRAVLLGVLGMAPFLGLEAFYDLLRWGVPFEAGYTRLVSGDLPVFFPYGQFSLAYVPRHLYAILMQPPEFVDGTLFFVRPQWVGMSLVLTSPALAFALVALVAARARPEVVPLVAAAALALLPDVTHGTVGFAQFGYRFSLDAQPFLLPLVALGAGWEGNGWRARIPVAFIALLAWSVAMNLYGVVAVTFFGYVS